MKSKTTGDLPSLATLAAAGTHFGHRRERSAPAAKKYTFIVRDGVSVINLEQTQEQLLAAAKYLEERVSHGDRVLLVGTKRQAAPAIAKIGQEIDAPYVSERWLGGTLTNFAIIRKNIDRLVEIDKVLADDSKRSGYTKREWARLGDEKDKLHSTLDGIVSMTKVPEIMIVVDPREEATAVREADRLGIPVIALCDTDVDPNQYFLPIPGNDDAPKTIELILNYLGEAISRGRAKAKA